jgi:hypothetical protein
MPEHGIALLSCKQLQSLFAGRTGRAWLDVLACVQDNELDGRDLSQHMGDPDALRAFLLDHLECKVTPLVANKLHSLIRNAAAGGAGGGTGASASFKKPAKRKSASGSASALASASASPSALGTKKQASAVRVRTARWQ